MKSKSFFIGLALFLSAITTSANAAFANGYVDHFYDWMTSETHGWVCNLTDPSTTNQDYIEIWREAPAGFGELVYSGKVAGPQNRTDAAFLCNGQPAWRFHVVFFGAGGEKPYWIYIRNHFTGELQLLAPSPFLPTH